MIFSPSPASFPLCRAMYIGNTACDQEVSKRLLLSSHELPLQPQHPCLWTTSTTRQQQQRASPDLLNGTLWGQSALASQEEVISQLLFACCASPASPALGLPAWGALFTLTDITALLSHCSHHLLLSLLAHCHPNSLGSFRVFFLL